MNPNVKPSAIYPVKGQIAPQSIAAAGNATSTWLDVTTGLGYISLAVLCGALGGGTLSVDILQATSNAGAGSKVLVTGALSALATNSSINLYDADLVSALGLDVNGAFKFVQVKVNNVGGTGALVAVAIVIGPARYPA